MAAAQAAAMVTFLGPKVDYQDFIVSACLA
jgi:hypothetical protein